MQGEFVTGIDVDTLRSRARRSDDGAMLILVLVVFTVIAIIVAAVVSQVETGVKGTPIVRSHLAKVYAADAGMEDALQSIKRDNMLCPDPAHEYDFPAQTFNSRQVDVHCKTISGSANGLLGYAVVVLDPTDSLTTQGGVSVAKQIDGPIYAKQLPASSNVAVTRGDVTEQKGRCSTDADKPADMTIATGYAFHCVPTGPVPDPDHALPSSVPTNAPAPNTTTVPGCKIFKPGKYTSAPVFAADNYFASGVYYFDNVGTITISSERAVAGKQASNELLINGNVACATDAQAGVSGSATGVKFIFGGNSALLVDNPSGEMEMFSWDDGVAGSSTAGTEGISIQTVDTTSGGWTKSTLAAGDAVIRVGDGTNTALSVHGMVYTPNALVDFAATNTSFAQLRGGLVAARLKLQASASASGLAVSVNVGTGKRHIVLTSKAKGVTDGGRDVIATTVFDIVSDTDRKVSIESWNTT